MNNKISNKNSNNSNSNNNIGNITIISTKKI